MKLDNLFPNNLKAGGGKNAQPAAKDGGGKPSRPFVSALTPGQEVDGVWLVLDSSFRAAKNGSKYVGGTLGDKTGTIPIRHWDASDADFATYKAGSFVCVRGRVETYRDRPQMIVFEVRPVEQDEVPAEDFLPASKRDAQEMAAELDAFVAGLSDPDYKGLLQSIFQNPQIRTAFLEGPAAASIHHAWRGGLAEHVLSAAKLAVCVCAQRPYLNRDLLLAGVLLHDVGKTEELDSGPGFQYTDVGRLCGHIALGCLLVERHILQLPNFPSQKRMLILHMILSHHGTKDFGSPVIPAIAEAAALHYLECLDAKCQGFQSEVERVRENGQETGWSDFIRVADGRIFIG